MPKRVRKLSEKAMKQEMHTPVKKQAMKVLSTVADADSFAESGGFQVGDKVFAKVKSCPQPWPAKILQKAVVQSTPMSNIPSTPGKGGKKEKAKAGAIKFLIQFYGTYDSEYVKPEQLLAYNEENSNKLGRPNPSRGATLFQVAMKEIQSCDSYPLPRTRRQSTRPAPVRQSTPPPRTRSAPAQQVQTPRTPGKTPEREDSMIEAESTFESPVQLPSSVAPGAQTPLSGLKASQTQTDPVKIQAVTPSSSEKQQQEEPAQSLQESGSAPEQDVEMDKYPRTRKRTRTMSAAAEATEEPKTKKVVKQKGGKKGKKPKAK